MRKQKTLFIFCYPLIIFAISIAAQTRRVSPEADTQMWNDLQLTVPLHQNVDFVFAGTVRIGRDITHPIDERLGAFFSFKLGKYVTLSPGYNYIATQPIEGVKGYENRLWGAAMVKFPLGKFSVTDRNLFERRLRNPVDSTRYRNRLQIEHPLPVWKLQGFVADEIFYDWSVNAWVRNRFAIGVSKKFNARFTADLYYLRQNDGRSRPSDLHVIGTAFKVRL